MEEQLPLKLTVFSLFEKEGNGLHLAMGVMCNMKRFYISANPHDLRLATSPDIESSLEMEYLKLHSELPDHDLYLDEQSFKSERDMAGWLIKPSKTLLRQLSSEQPISEYTTVEDYVDPITFGLKLVNVDGELRAERCDVELDITAEIHRVHRLQESDLPNHDYARVPASAVQLTMRKNMSKFYTMYAEEVTLDGGSECFLKLPNLRELRTYQRMENAEKLPADLRVPKVLGLVEGKDQSIVGVLFTLIDYKHELQDEMEEPDNTITLAEKKKWFGQVKYIVSKLHEAGICWGDVAPSNVMIDMEDNAWVVDFAGRFTEGFGVTEDNFDTVEGDLEGLKHLAKYMGIEED